MYIPSDKYERYLRCTIHTYIHTQAKMSIVNIFRCTSTKASDINYPNKDEKSAQPIYIPQLAICISYETLKGSIFIVPTQPREGQRTHGIKLVQVKVIHLQSATLITDTCSLLISLYITFIILPNKQFHFYIPLTQSPLQKHPNIHTQHQQHQFIFARGGA